jgi:hypothetical protein
MPVEPAVKCGARERSACFGAFGDDVHSYCNTASLGLSESCED